MRGTTRRRTQWLNECEHMIQMRILDAAPEQCVTYDADTERGTPLARAGAV